MHVCRSLCLTALCPSFLYKYITVYWCTSMILKNIYITAQITLLLQHTRQRKRPNVEQVLSHWCAATSTSSWISSKQKQLLVTQRYDRNCPLKGLSRQTGPEPDYGTEKNQELNILHLDYVHWGSTVEPGQGKAYIGKSLVARHKLQEDSSKPLSASGGESSASRRLCKRAWVAVDLNEECYQAVQGVL